MRPAEASTTCGACWVSCTTRRRAIASTQTASMKSIRELVRSARATGATIDALVMVDGPIALRRCSTEPCYRLVQEALTNAIKHADGAPVFDLRGGLARRGSASSCQQPRARCVDCGGARCEHGVVGMRERVETLGGEAWIGAPSGRSSLTSPSPGSKWSRRHLAIRRFGIRSDRDVIPTRSASARAHGQRRPHGARVCR